MVLVFYMLAFSPSSTLADDYQFDPSEIEKKPYSIGGFLEFMPVVFGLDRDAAFYRLRFSDEDRGATLEQYNLGLRLEGSYEKGIARAYFRTDSRLRYDDWGWDNDIVLQEGYLSLKPASSLTMDTGKEVLPWGKGYAFNPVAFVSRPKDPNDPTEAREGFWVATADLIKSLEGPLKTVSLTPVIMPVTNDLNDDFSREKGFNFAAKLYLLLWDTDLDLLFFTGSSRSSRYGLDFSRNIKTNFEIHGELAWITDFEKKSIDQWGRVSTEEDDILRFLFGVRYLTAGDITYIVEYYHNGGGIDADDAENFYRLVDRAYETFLSTGDNFPIDKASSVSRNTLATAKPMRDYLYFRASWKEPFDILYFTPALTAIVNLNDKSFSLTPELAYKPITNLELRLRSALLTGSRHTEYGEKQNDYKIELRARYYF